jgi:chromosome segregation ATPase
MTDSEKASLGGPSRAKHANNARNIDNLERLLEEDSVALDGMRREISEAQKLEIDNFRNALTVLKREYDNIRTSNDVKEKSLTEKLARVRALSVVSEANNSTVSEAQKVKSSLSGDLSDVSDALAAEQRSLNMQSLMIHRLDEEIHKVKSEQADISYGIEQAKHELTNVESSHRLNKHELLEQEKLMDSLTRALRTRREKRVGKLQLLHNMVTEETSAAKTQLDSVRDDVRNIKTIFPSFYEKCIVLL